MTAYILDAASEHEQELRDDEIIDKMSESLYESMSRIEQATPCEKIYALLEVAVAIMRDAEDEDGNMAQFLEEAFCESLLDLGDESCGVRVH